MANNTAKPDKLAETEAQIKDVVSICKSNIELLLERDTKLEDLESQSALLKDRASYFHSNTKKLKWSMWCHDKKLLLIMISVILILLTIVIIAAVYA